MPEPLSALDRITWAGRFKDKRVYPDDKILKMIEAIGDDPSEHELIIVAEAQARGLR